MVGGGERERGAGQWWMVEREREWRWAVVVVVGGVVVVVVFGGDCGGGGDECMYVFVKLKYANH